MEGVVNPWTSRIIAALHRQLEAIIEVGKLLAAAKDDLPHGEFQHMIEQELPFGPRQARAYMKVAADPRIAERKHASVLPPSVNTLAVLTRLSNAAFEGAIENGTIRADMSREAAKALVRGVQVLMFDEGAFYLSSTGRVLARIGEEDDLAPDWLKVEQTTDKVFDEITGAFRALRQLAAYIAEPNALERFQTIFARMEKRVAELVDEQRRAKAQIARPVAAYQEGQQQEIALC